MLVTVLVTKFTLKPRYGPSKNDAFVYGLGGVFVI